MRDQVQRSPLARTGRTAGDMIGAPVAAREGKQGMKMSHGVTLMSPRRPGWKSCCMRLALTGALLVAPCAGAARAQTRSSSTGPWQTYGTENGEWRSYAGGQESLVNCFVIRYLR